MKRLWGIRHIRYVVFRWRVYRWAWFWGERGLGMGFPHAHDLRVLDAIWEGKA